MHPRLSQRTDKVADSDSDAVADAVGKVRPGKHEVDKVNTDKAETDKADAAEAKSSDGAHDSGEASAA
jgi:hypothetical protein